MVVMKKQSNINPGPKAKLRAEGVDRLNYRKRNKKKYLCQRLQVVRGWKQLPLFPDM